MADKKVGIGIIGTGFAESVQIPAFLACPGAEIVSIASGHLENARRVAEKFGVAHSTGDWRETASHEHVDLVCISTPPNLHREMALYALEHDKNVMCEKPMAMNVAEAAEMTSAPLASDKITLIDHELRFQPGRQTAYAMLRDGAIGRVRYVKGVFQSSHRADPDLGWHWWSDAAQGGGALGAIGSHIVDSLHWLLGTEIESVIAQLEARYPTRVDERTGEPRAVTADDQANMLLRFADGEVLSDATGIISISMAEYPKYRNVVALYGETGAMVILPKGQIAIARPGADAWEPVEVDEGYVGEGMPDNGFSRGFMQLAPKLIAAIQNGDRALEHAASFSDGLKIQHVLDAARESDRDGTRVVVGY